MDYSRKNTIVVTCAPGLAPCLEWEVESLDYEIKRAQDTSVETFGSVYDAMRMCFHSRTAFNVLYLLTEFKCDTPGGLYQRTGKIPWEDIIPDDGYFCVTSKVDTPAIDNWMYPNLKMKDAIADRLRERVGSRADSGPKRDHTVITLHWKDDFCRIFINVAGTKLSDRGYRLLPHKAPMRETLAVGTIMETGYSGETPFVNPMCGSGTLAIEAALMALEKAPGLLRDNFGFKHLKGLDLAPWQQLCEAGQAECLEALPAPIIATDIDPDAIEAAKKNAEAAGVAHLIDFQVCDFEETTVPPGPGVVLVNPEYGERLGNVKELEATYKRIGDFFKAKCAGYTACIFTGNLPLAKRVGLRTSQRIPFNNADIECRLLKYEMYEGTRRTPKPEPEAKPEVEDTPDLPSESPEL
jgi:putative N6-adenine-specific DNA methylase